MDPDPRSPNNKFIESERKYQSESRIKILVYSVKREELHAHRCKKYPRTSPSIGTKSNEFFFFTVVFLQPFALFFSFFFFFLPFLSSFLFIFLRLIYYGFTPFPPSTCESSVGSHFFLFPCLFLNLPFLGVRLLVHCSGITSTLMRSESQLSSI